MKSYMEAHGTEQLLAAVLATPLAVFLAVCSLPQLKVSLQAHV